MMLIREIMYCMPGKAKPRYHDLVDHGRRDIFQIEG